MSNFYLDPRFSFSGFACEFASHPLGFLSFPPSLAAGFVAAVRSLVCDLSELQGILEQNAPLSLFYPLFPKFLPKVPWLLLVIIIAALQLGTNGTSPPSLTP